MVSVPVNLSSPVAGVHPPVIFPIFEKCRVSSEATKPLSIFISADWISLSSLSEIVIELERISGGSFSGNSSAVDSRKEICGVSFTTFMFMSNCFSAELRTPSLMVNLN